MGWRVLVVALVVAPFLAGCTATKTEKLRDYAFTPDTLELAVGSTVQFTNDGPSKHTVTIHDPTFQTALDKEVAVGGSVQYTFPKAGSYHVFCRFHEKMVLDVKVA